MRINVKAKNTQVTEPLTDYINKRFSKLEKYFVDADLAGTVTLIVEKGIHRVSNYSAEPLYFTCRRKQQ